MGFSNYSRFQSYYRYKNIINVNKNSKLEEFYNVRNFFIFYRKPYKFKRLIRRFRNMKWMIAKFKMVPRILLYPSLFKKHNYTFKKKQQVKLFYGKLSEKKFKKTVLKAKNSSKTLENSSFFSVIETRLDMLLYRAKFLPTIFSCNQLLTHKKIVINNNIITNKITYPVKKGDIVSLKKNYWGNVYRYLMRKSNKRFIGHTVLKRRLIIKPFKKKSNRGKLRKIFYKNIKYSQFFKKYKKRFKFYFRKLKYIAKSRNKLFLNGKYYQMSLFFSEEVLQKLKDFSMMTKHLKRWNVANYVHHDLLAYIYKHQLRYFLIVFNMFLKKYFLGNYMIMRRVLFRKKKPLHKFVWQYTDLVAYNFLDDYILPIKEDTNINVKHHFMFYTSLETKPRSKEYRVNNPAHLETYPWFYPTPQWYTPTYLETDYACLRIGVVQQPQESDIIFPFNVHLSSFYNFYSLKGY